MFCIQCGAEALATAKFCHSCGTSLAMLAGNTADATAMPSKELGDRATPVAGHTWRCSRCSRLNRPGTLVCQCGQDFSGASTAEGNAPTPAKPVPLPEPSTARRVVRLLVRLGMGAISVALAVMSTEIAKEEGADGLVASLAFALCGGLLAYAIFFRWPLTRVLLCGERRGSAGGGISRRARSVGVALITLGALGLLTAALSFLGMAGLPSVPPEVVMLTVFLLILSLVCSAVGVGLRREASWARRAALILGFVFFGGIPIGTALGVYLWWFAGSSVVRKQFETTGRRGLTATAG